MTPLPLPETPAPASAPIAPLTRIRLSKHSRYTKKKHNNKAAAKKVKDKKRLAKLQRKGSR